MNEEVKARIMKIAIGLVMVAWLVIFIRLLYNVTFEYPELIVLIGIPVSMVYLIFLDALIKI